MRVACSVTLCLAVFCAALPCLASPTAPAKPPPSSLMRDDPLLQDKVTVEATDRSLGDVLAQLSATLKVDLTVSAKIADQRVTLRLMGQPLYRLMDRLPRLLSHSAGTTHGYYWEKLDRPAKSRPAFNLWRDLRSVQDEERELEYPRREAIVMLQNMRDVIPLSFEERQKFKSDYPPARYSSGPPGTMTPLERALQGLSDAEIAALVDGEKMPLDPVRFAKAVADGKRQQRDQWKKDQEFFVQNGQPDPYPHGFPEQPDAPLVLSVTRADEDDQNQGKATEYRINLQGILYSGTTFDVYDTNADRDPNMAALPAAGSKEPVFDLSPLLTDKSVTPAQRGDVGFALQALAKTAHVNLYQESFFKEGATARADTPGFVPLKGTLPQLVAGLCREWNFHAEKVGNDYLFWSRIWALDRAADIPERVLSKWQTRFHSQGGLTLNDDTEIAAALTWPQVNLTLNLALPDSGPWDRKKSYNALRLLGLLSPWEQDAARTPGGLPLADLPPDALEALATAFPKNLASLSEDQWSQAVLTLETPPPNWSARMVGVNVQVGGHPLFGTMLATYPPPAAPASPPPAASARS